MKYKITDIVHPDNPKLKRIRALTDFADVRAGDLGGWIESEANLSQDGDCWISDDAWVSGNAQVYDNARVYGNAKISGNVRVCHNVRVCRNAWVGGNALVSGDSKVSGDSETVKPVYKTIVMDGIEYNLVPRDNA